MAKKPGEASKNFGGRCGGLRDVTACSICRRNYGWMQWMADGINDSIVTDHQKNPREQLIFFLG